MSEKLDKAIEFIKSKGIYVIGGIYGCRNTVGDEMTNIYHDAEGGVDIDICYNYDYLEVFGLNDEEFKEFSAVCHSLVPDEERWWDHLNDDENEDKIEAALQLCREINPDFFKDDEE